MPVIAIKPAEKRCQCLESEVEPIMEARTGFGDRLDGWRCKSCGGRFVGNPFDPLHRAQAAAERAT